MSIQAKSYEWLRNNTFLATWCQAVVIIVSIIVAYAQYYSNVERIRTVNSLEFLNIYFTSESINNSRQRLGTHIEKFYREIKVPILNDKNLQRQMIIEDVTNRSMDFYNKNSEMRGDINNILHFIDSIYECALVDACDKGAVRHMGSNLITNYYLFLKPIVACTTGNSDQRFEAYYDWLSDGRNKRHWPYYIDTKEIACPKA